MNMQFLVSTDLKIRKSNTSLEFFQPHCSALLFGLRHCSKVPIFPKLIEDLRGKIPSQSESLTRSTKNLCQQGVFYTTQWSIFSRIYLVELFFSKMDIFMQQVSCGSKLQGQDFFTSKFIINFSFVDKTLLVIKLNVNWLIDCSTDPKSKGVTL